jgi:hypothetical protein
VLFIIIIPLSIRTGIFSVDVTLENNREELGKAEGKGTFNSRLLPKVSTLLVGEGI